ncbi:MAG: LD-carboxypeptidase [Candidatus Binatia bacterium]
MKDQSSLIRPRPLTKGDRVAIVAPAGAYDPVRLVQAATILESWGLLVEVPAPAKPFRYLAASDEERAQRLTEAFAREDIAAVLAVRGGYGTARLQGRFQAAAVRPKIFVGYSDLSILLWRLRAEAGLLCFHGPMAASDLPRLDPEQLERFRRFLFGEQGWWAGSNLVARAPGMATGRLVGGCLSVLATTLGTPYEVDTRGGVLFLEEVGESPYRIDRLLTQLLHARKLEGVSAVVLGTFHGCGSEDDADLVMDIFDEILAPLGIPVLSGFDAGHQSGGAVLPMGCQVRVSADARSIELLEPVLGGRATAAPVMTAGQRDAARMVAAALRRGPAAR